MESIILVRGDGLDRKVHSFFITKFIHYSLKSLSTMNQGKFFIKKNFIIEGDNV